MCFLTQFLCFTNSLNKVGTRSFCLKALWRKQNHLVPDTSTKMAWDSKQYRQKNRT